MQVLARRIFSYFPAMKKLRANRGLLIVMIITKVIMTTLFTVNKGTVCNIRYKVIIISLTKLL